MSAAAFPVGEGTRVLLNFSLSLEDGEVVDSNFDRDAVSFDIGDGSLLPGFERRLFGLCAGDSERFVMEPEDGFGMPNPENIQLIARSSFDEDVELEAGLMLAFNDAAGGELPGVVVEFDDENVAIDFNHPLAGRRLIFEVKIQGVEAAEVH